MKKRTKTLIGVFSSLLVSSLAIGLTTGFVATKNNYSVIHNKKDEFAEEENVKNLLSDIFANDLFTINNYVAEQKLIKEQKIAELKLALTYFNPNWVNIADDEGITSSKTEYRNTRIHSSNILFYNLTSNWYWMLKNIDKFEFVNWPYKLNLFQKKGFFGTQTNETKEFVGDVINFESQVNEDGKIAFDFSSLEDGFVYEIESIHEKEQRSNDYPLHNFSFYDRVINKIKNWDNGYLKLKINVGLKHQNQEMVLNVFDTENKKNLQIDSSVNERGLIEFDLQQLPYVDLEIKNLKLKTNNQEVLSTEDLKNMQIATLDKEELNKPIKLSNKIIFDNNSWFDNNKTVVLSFLKRKDNKNNLILKNNTIQEYIKVSEDEIYQNLESTNNQKKLDNVKDLLELQKQNETSKYEAYYLKYANNVVIRVIKVTTKDEEILVRLDHDVMVFEEQVNDLYAFALEHESNFKVAQLELLKNKINKYDPQYFEETEFENATELEEFRDFDRYDERFYDDFEEEYKDEDQIAEEDKEDYKVWKQQLEKLFQAVKNLKTKEYLNSFLNEAIFNNKEYHDNIDANYLAFLSTRENHNIKRYILKNINNKFLYRSSDFVDNTNNPTNVNKLPDHLKEFVDNDLDVFVKNKSIEEVETQKIIEKLTRIVFAKNPQDFKVYKIQQEDKENQAKIIAKFKEYAQIFAQEKIGKNSSELNKKEFEVSPTIANLIYYSQDKNNKLGEYRKFVSQNWYFILNNLDKFEYKFIEWYRLPKTKDRLGNKEFAEHNQAFLDLLKQKNIYADLVTKNKNIDDLREGDASKHHKSINAQWFLVQNKNLFEINVDGSKTKDNVDFKPWTLYFGESKNKISISALTQLFHFSFGHGDQKYYDEYEEKFIKEYQYGVPAKMMLVWKGEDNE